MLLDRLAELLDLPLPDKRRAVDAREVLGQASGGIGAGGVGEEFEFVESVEQVLGRRVWRLDADEDGGLTSAGSRWRQKAIR